MRIGQAVGLRHSDVVSHERRIEIVPREDNANGARGKRGGGWVPITSELVRLHSDYMHLEYADLERLRVREPVRASWAAASTSRTNTAALSRPSILVRCSLPSELSSLARRRVASAAASTPWPRWRSVRRPPMDRPEARDCSSRTVRCAT